MDLLTGKGLGGLTIGVLGGTTSMWGWVLAQEIGSTGIGAAEAIPAAALTATSGALVWVVKKVVSGELVHRDPQRANIALSDLLKEMSAVIAAATAATAVSNELTRELLNSIAKIEAKNR